MPSILEGIAQAIRDESKEGKRHVDIARELKVSPRTIGAIVWHDRTIGPETLESIFAANPPWLLAVVMAALGKPGSRKRKRTKGAGGPGRGQGRADRRKSPERGDEGFMRR